MFADLLSYYACFNVGTVGTLLRKIYFGGVVSVRICVEDCISQLAPSWLRRKDLCIPTLKNTFLPTFRLDAPVVFRTQAKFARETTLLIA